MPPTTTPAMPTSTSISTTPSASTSRPHKLRLQSSHRGPSVAGVVAAVEAHSTDHVAYDSTVKLVTGGSIASTSANQATSPGTTRSACRRHLPPRYGSSSTPGSAASAGDVNDSGFGLAVSYDPAEKTSFTSTTCPSPSAIARPAPSPPPSPSATTTRPILSFSSSTYSTETSAKTITVNLSAPRTRRSLSTTPCADGTAHSTASEDYTATGTHTPPSTPATDAPSPFDNLRHRRRKRQVHQPHP